MTSNFNRPCPTTLAGREVTDWHASARGGSLHTSLPPGRIWTAKNGKELRRLKWVVARKRATTWVAGRHGAGGGLGTGSEGPSMTLKRGDWLAKSGGVGVR